MKSEGRDFEYDAFENLDAAAQYAFGKDDVATQKAKSKAPYINAVSKISPFLDMHREKQIEIVQSPFSSATLSRLEELPQDILTNIFTYHCPEWWDHVQLNHTISIIGMISK